MRLRKGSDARVILVAAITTMAVVGAPAIAETVQKALFAENSDKVDGRHAVGAGASAENRAGKLVATDNQGRLPNNIIKKAPDANKLDGRDFTEFVDASGTSQFTEMSPDWNTNDDISQNEDATFVNFTPNETGTGFIEMMPHIPAKLLGQQLALESFEVCYSVNGSTTTIEQFRANVWSSAEPGNSSGVAMSSSDSPRTNDICEVVTGDPIPMPDDGFIVFRVETETTDIGGSFYIDRVTFDMGPVEI